VIIYELPHGDHEVAHGEFSFQFQRAFHGLPLEDRFLGTGAKTCFESGRKSARQPDASFIPSCLPKPSPNPSDAQGNPWPTIVCEVARSQSLASVIQKVNSFWLAPNRVEDVIVFKLWPWNHGTDTNGRPLRRLTVHKHPSKSCTGKLEFGTINKYGVPYNGCSASGMRTLTIARECAYEGCTPPYPPYPIAGNVVIDLFDIQRAVFKAQGI
ncbi:7244_t:CDS:2, partial [Dentiscutata erythropus]